MSERIILTPITLEQYAGPYLAHPDFTPERRANAAVLLSKVNELRQQAADDGVDFHDDPDTGCGISGEKNGGFRPMDCPVGAAGSTHKKGRGIDNYDPHRAFAAWCYANPDRLKALGLCMENCRWTPNWLHLQDIPPGPAGSPWRLDFIPNSTQPLVAALPAQLAWIAQANHQVQPRRLA